MGIAGWAGDAKCKGQGGDHVAGIIGGGCNGGRFRTGDGKMGGFGNGGVKGGGGEMNRIPQSAQSVPIAHRP